MYSQNNEQEVILSYFKDKTNGSFCEVGAYDPKVFSNTRALVELGWSGIYVEPVAAHVEKFKKEYRDNTKIEIIQAALTVEDHDVVFYECDDAVSTTEIDHRNKWEQSGIAYKQTTVPSLTIDKLVTMTVGYDFLNLDTEGTSYQLFTWLPDGYLESLRMVCIEHDGKTREIIARMRSLGFGQLLSNGENIIMAK